MATHIEERQHLNSQPIGSAQEDVSTENIVRQDVLPVQLIRKNLFDSVAIFIVIRPKNLM